MKYKKMVMMIGMLVVLFSVILTACSSNEPKKPEYTKENITLKFKNESGIKCYIEISGNSSPSSVLPFSGWENIINFPTVLKTEIPDGMEKSITVKDVVVSGKTSSMTVTYQPHLGIKAFCDDSKYKDGFKRFVADSKDQYTGGTFRIKLKKDQWDDVFDIDFVN